MVKYASIFLKFISLGLVIAAGTLWAGAEVSSRPKYRDEQTLIGGAVWTQTIIPIGLIITSVINEELHVFVHAYFLIAGTFLLVTTGLVLVIGEYKSIRRQQRRQAISTVPLGPQAEDMLVVPTYDKMYLSIGVLVLVAGILTLADFFLNIV